MGHQVRLSASRVSVGRDGEKDWVWSEEDPYVLVPQGTIGDSFEFGASMTDVKVDEQIARIPEGVQAPEERQEREESLGGVQVCGISSLDAFLQVPGSERRWYDSLLGEQLCIESEAEDLVEVSSLIEDLDEKRKVKLRMIREQESCLGYELSQGEGRATKDWLVRSYADLGELEAQMMRLQSEQVHRLGQAPVMMTPVFAALSVGQESETNGSDE